MLGLRPKLFGFLFDNLFECVWVGRCADVDQIPENMFSSLDFRGVRNQYEYMREKKKMAAAAMFVVPSLLYAKTAEM